jgi:hypothetical protein
MMANAGTQGIKDLVVQSIVALSDVRLVPDCDAKYESKGTPLERGMIQFLIDFDIKANEHGSSGDGYDLPNMLKYVNDIRPRVQMLPFD